MKNVVYIRTSEIYNDSRATKEIKTLLDAGFYVEVFSWNRNGLAKTGCEIVFGNYQNIKFHFFDAILPHGMGMKNIHKLIKWRKWVIDKLPRASDVDFVHACDLDAGICVSKYCRINKVKLIYDIFDYYVDSHRIPSVLSALVAHKENAIINQSFATIICTEERREQIGNAEPSSVVVIHNSPDLSTVKAQDEEICYDYVYCGSMGPNRLLAEIIDEYKNNSDLKIVFAGNGPMRKMAEKTSEVNDHFDYLGPISYSEVLDIESRALCLSAIYNPNLRGHQLCAPNKLYEALALGKPLIVCRGTGMDAIVTNNKIGVLINYNVNEFYNAIRTIKQSKDIIINASTIGPEIYRNQYSWELMQERLLSIYGYVS